MKMKIAACIVAATAVAGGGGALAVRAADGGDATTSGGVIRARVVAVEGAKITISAGARHGVRAGFEFEITRDGRKVATVKVTVLEVEQCKGEAVALVEDIQVGDLARTRLTKVDVGPAPGPKSPAGGEAVKGLKLEIAFPHPGGVCSAACHARLHRANGLHKCATCDEMCNIAHKYCPACAKRLGACQVCGKAMKAFPENPAFAPGAPIPLAATLRNVTKKAIHVWSRNCSWGHRRITMIFTDVATGRQYRKTEPARAWSKNVPTAERLGVQTVFFDDAKLETGGGRIPPGTYRVQAVYANDDDGAKFNFVKPRIWTGTVTSNELRLTLAAAPAPKTVAEKLERKISLEFVDTPLDQTLAFLSDMGGVNIVLDASVRNQPVTLRLKNMTVRQALDWITRLTGAKWEVKNGAVLVTAQKTEKPAPSATEGRDIF